MIRVDVPLPDRSYPVLVGRGVVSELAAVVPLGAKRAAIVTQPGIPVSVDPGIEHGVFEIDDGEGAKRLATIENLCRRFSRWGLTRRDVVIGVGGGVVTDVAGFAAAVYHRGTAVVHVATSLLGQIDAAIGGKTGVNLPEGKNLIGAFWQPSAVICDTATLETLPPAEYRSGLGEMAKYHFLSGEPLDDLPFDARVARCVELKGLVVAADEREGGQRALLNYGHTLAHALEASAGFALRHGEAVAIGLHYAALLAERTGRIDRARVDDHRRVLAGYELPSAVPDGVDRGEVAAAFARDKKAIDGLTFVLDGHDGLEVVTGVDAGVAAEVLEAMP